MYAKVLISLVANTLLVVVSFPVEEDTNQSSNPGGSGEKNPCWQPEK